MILGPVKNTLALAIMASMLGACGFADRREDAVTLAAIEPVTLPDASRDLPAIEIDQVVAQYQAVLEVASDPKIHIKVQQRLAGLQMLRSEQQQAEATQSRRYFDEAIALYQDLLDAHPDRPDNDRLLYQMAKAYELDGRVEESREALGRLAASYPQSDYYTEARFRHGELLFSQQRYGEAEQAYRAVLEEGASPYYGNALYMHGWSLFKQTHYEASLASFTQVLDQTVPASGNIQQLARAELEMVQDTLRVMSLAFSYLDGPQSIHDYYVQLGERSYTHLLYQQLGALYLEKERFRDSAETYASYVGQYPHSDYAPQFSVLLVEVYQRGGFPSEILPAKEDFASRYGIHSEYWNARDDAARQALRPHLHQYLEELAKHYHATAQMLQADLAKAPAAPAAAQDMPDQRDIRDAFLTASMWYAEFAETFPADEKTPEMVFLMAESLNEAGQLPRAIDAYERVAYEYRDDAHGAEAGYSAILAYQRHAATLGAEAAENWQLQKIESALRFAEVYPADPRALPVLVSAAEELLAAGNPSDAVVAASRVTDWQPAADAQSLRTAWLVQGHGNFQLANFNAAELAYIGALGVIAADDPVRAGTIDSLAASIYKQAEAHLAVDESSQAVDDFLRVAAVAPDSDIAANAHYDGANLLMQMQDWDRAQSEWRQFRHDYPEHELSASIPAKLALIYQEQEQWRQAADELSLIAAADDDTEVRRQSLYLAAELYERDGAQALAIDRYRQYVNNWPQPFQLATEARYKLSLLYESQGDPNESRVWLRELMASHDHAGTAANERSRYLAAMAAAVFAEDAYRAFRAAPLNLPLKRSLGIKKTLMKASLAACERVLAYGVADFVTEASFRIGEIYATLSDDLMQSERPAELNALELEQYEMLLEEQAYPFEEQAIAVHETNARRSWSGVYDRWVRSSIETLAILLPARYGKSEKLVRYSNDIY